MRPLGNASQRARRSLASSRVWADAVSARAVRRPRRYTAACRGQQTSAPVGIVPWIDEDASRHGPIQDRNVYGRGRCSAGLRLLTALAFVLVGSFAGVTAVAAQDVYSDETLEISRKLQCPVCEGQTVADSTSKLAVQMRAIIEEKVQAGESEEQIIDFFVARYGESIVTEPPKSGFSLALWWMPVVVVVLGAVVVGVFVRERTRTAPRRAVAGDETASDDELEAIAREVLGPPGGERMSGA